MRAEICKQFDFSASHELKGLPKTHKCSRMHGHNYRVRLSIQGEIVFPGFVLDYGDLNFVKQWIDSFLDHRHLNDVMQENPTAENLAGHILEFVVCHLRHLEHTNLETASVSVSETPKTWATVQAPIDAGHQPVRQA